MGAAVESMERWDSQTLPRRCFEDPDTAFAPDLAPPRVCILLLGKRSRWCGSTHAVLAANKAESAALINSNDLLHVLSFAIYVQAVDA